MNWIRLCASMVLQMGIVGLLSFAGFAEEIAPTPYPDGFVVAKSRFGNGSVRGQVRRADLGWQVQLPNGRWVYCRRSCSETLRVETVDFFEPNMAGSGQLTNECGIFGCLDLKYPR